MFFVDYSSAFNTIVPSQLINRLYALGLSPSICIWLLDFLTSHSQSVRLDKHTSSTPTLSTGMPHGCVLSPCICTLFTQSNIIVKFADDRTVIGLILNNYEAKYKEDFHNLTAWCDANNLVLNTKKTKEDIGSLGPLKRPLIVQYLSNQRLWRDSPADRKALQQVLNTAQVVVGTELPSL